MHDAEELAVDELLASAGFAELTARPPDHVAFSPGVRTSFGFPRAAARPPGP